MSRVIDIERYRCKELEMSGIIDVGGYRCQEL